MARILTCCSYQGVYIDCIPYGSETDVRFASRDLAELARTTGFGLRLKAIFRLGENQPIIANTNVQVGDVPRLRGPDFCLEKAAKVLGSQPIGHNTVAEVMFLAIGFVIGINTMRLRLTVIGLPRGKTS